tara:strand:+ start:112128 stop:117635 length:5508 start_codon:yes stop_codon:yes gene_type:complete
MRGFGVKKQALWLMAAVLMALHGQAAAVESCDAIFPTTLSAHDPDSFLRFYGGWVSDSPTNVMRARNKLDLSLLPLSCDSASCVASGQASAALALPTFLTTNSTSKLSIGWFGNTTYQGTGRDFSEVKVGWLGKARLAPVVQTWRIKEITLSSSATLELAPGDYWVENLSLALDSVIQPVGEGTVRLFVKNTFHAPWYTAINMEDGADPSRLIIVGWDDIRVHGSADVAATLYAANKVLLDTFVTVKGDVAASEIEMQLFSKVTALTSSQREATDYGEICNVSGDLDGDGIPDSIDNDIDGDGVDNLDEIAAGTDPEDASDYPDVIAPSVSINLSQPYQQEAAQLSLGGNVSDEGGPYAGLATVLVTNTTTGQSIAATVSGGSYTASILLDFGDNQISVSATDTSGNEKVISAIATRVDNSAPSISLDGLPNESVDAVTYFLTGTVTDGVDGSGIADVSVINAALPATQIDVLVEGETFSAEVPLVFGENEITVTVADGFQLQSTASKSVTRVDTVAPTLTLDNPPSQNVSAPQVLVSGVVVDNVIGSGMSSLTLNSDRAGIPPQSLTIQPDGTFSTTIALLAGNNVLTLVASDQFGNQSSATLTVTRPDLDGDGLADDVDPDRDNDGYSNDDEISAGTDPNNAEDYPDTVAPTLTTTLQDNAEQEVTERLITGDVTDSGGPHAGVVSVTVNNVQTSASVNATITGDAWQVTVDLAFGSNTLNIIAQDAAGNITTLTRTVIRQDATPPQLTLEDGSDLSVEAVEVVVRGSANDGAHGQGVQSITVVNAQLPSTVIAVQRSGDNFEAVVPLAFGVNLLTITATDGQGLMATVTKTVTRIDTIAPEIILSVPSAQDLSAPSAAISGSVVDNQNGSGIASATLTNDRGMAPLSLSLSEDGSFNINVSIEAGDNNFVVTAVDHSGNTTSVNVAITRPDQDNDGIADDVDPDRDGDGYSNEDEIARGTNPDDGADYPDDIAPTLTVNNADGQTTTANQITVTGSASDDRGVDNVSSITVYNAAYGTSFSVTLDSNGNFSAYVPLKVGDNSITIAATDGSANSTSTSLTIRRLSPPTLQSLQPSSGAVIDAERVTLSGLIVTELDENLLRLTVNNAQVVFAPRDGNGYPFSVTLPLAYGSNNFSVNVSSPDGSDAATLTISRLPENPDNVAAPSLTLLAPNNSQWLSGEAVNVVGRATSYAGTVSVTVNGVPVTVTGDGTSGSFSTALYFADGQTDMAIHVVATDQLGRQTSEAVSVQRDISAPIISLDNNFEPLPADNAVTESRLVLSGTVSDPNLSGMLIDTTSPTLTPTAQPGVFTFSRDMSLSGGSREIILSAHDDAGNITLQRYQLSLDPAALLKPVLPVDGSRFSANGAPVMVQVAARLAGIAPGATAQVLVNGTPYPVNLTDTLLSGDVALPAESGAVTLRYEVRHPQSGLVAATEIQVEVVDQAAQPLRLDAVTPNANSQNVSANQLITLFFNKAIDPTQLTLTVKETLHGFTYINNDPPGTDFVRAKGYELEEVHRDLALVPGTLDVAPGARMVSFKPDRFFGYGASIFLEVTYAGESLGRVLFTTESLPTQLTGVLTDQFGQPAGGVTVALGDITSVTGKAGGFSFGFVDAQRGLKGGTYDLSVNPNGKDPRFGTRLRSVYLDQGRYKKLATMIVPLLNENTGFDVLQSGLISSLAGGVVEVDLLDASINDQRGRTTVQVNTQVVEPFSLGFDAQGSAPMFGMFTLQPEGIEVSGNPRVTLPLPTFEGSADLFVDDALLFVMGLNAERSAMVPVAVAVVSGGRAVTQGTWQGDWLDYLGLGPIPPEANAAVEQFLQTNGDWASVRRALGLQ